MRFLSDHVRVRTPCDNRRVRIRAPARTDLATNSRNTNAVHVRKLIFIPCRHVVGEKDRLLYFIL